MPRTARRVPDVDTALAGVTLTSLVLTTAVMWGALDSVDVLRDAENTRDYVVPSSGWHKDCCFEKLPIGFGLATPRA